MPERRVDLALPPSGEACREQGRDFLRIAPPRHRERRDRSLRHCGTVRMSAIQL
jgi:hypothetical protein